MKRDATFYENLEKRIHSGDVSDEEIRELFTRQSKLHKDVIAAISGKNTEINAL